MPTLITLKGGSTLEDLSLMKRTDSRIALHIEFPFLQGRALVFASKFAKFLPVELSMQYLDAALAALESSETGIPVKVSAVRAIRK